MFGMTILNALASFAILGLVVGFMAGLFGVGGGFLLTPLLNILFGVPYNVAVGSDLAQMAGMSTAATIRHGRIGNIDYRLGLLMCAGTAGGVEVGATGLEVLKRAGHVTLGHAQIPVMTLVMSVIYMVLLVWIGTVVLRESRKALASVRAGGSDTIEKNWFVERLSALHLPPMISLPRSGIASISLWVILGVGFATGVLAGLLGVGGGFIRMPALIYIIGCPTAVAVGTDLFEIMFSSAYGAFTHGMKGNVNLVLVLGLLIGSTLGSQIGASLTRRLGGPRLRNVFAYIAYFAVLMVAAKLVMKVLHGGG
ncbi:MAG: sulfite exporter TauE/SafE family protein [Polyangiaceae bacterium]|nr:sulfite exporter TauE/SafE family protein [Polyangiaceae bacterium]